jgi:hypothetical protein
VHALQPGDAALHRLGKFLVGEMHVDILRVAALVGQPYRVQHRRLRRFNRVGVVGVVALAGNVTPPVGIAILVRNVVDQRAVRQRELRVVLREDLAEKLDGGVQLCRRQLLVAKYQNRMVDERTVEPNSGRRVDRLAQIDAAHFRAGVRRQLLNRVSQRRRCHSASPGQVRRLPAVARLIKMVRPIEFKHEIAIARR